VVGTRTSIQSWPRGRGAPAPRTRIGEGLLPEEGVTPKIEAPDARPRLHEAAARQVVDSPGMDLPVAGWEAGGYKGKAPGDE
jgi:hypothetical protein